MLQNVFDRVMTGVTKRAAEVQAAAAKQQEPLHTQSFANRAHAAGECKTRTAQKAHVEAAKAHAHRVIEINADQSEITKRDVLGNLLTVVQDSQHPGDWAIRACLNYMNSPNSMTKGLALLTHAKLLDLMPADKRSSELLAAVQTVATSLRSMDEIEVQYALKYVASCWDADLVSNIIGLPGQPRRMGGPSSQENVTLLSIILPDTSEARKPALSSVSTIKQALAALTSLIQRFGEQVESSIDLLDVTNQICQRHLSHVALSLPTSNLLRVVIARSAARSNLAAATKAFTATTTRALEDATSRTPLSHYTLQALAATLVSLCADTVPTTAAAALSAALDAATHATMSSDDHEVASAFGTVSQCVISVSSLPPGAPRVPELQQKATDATRQMFAKGKSMKPSQWRNPNNLQFEGLRCVVALQVCKPSVATPFREEIVSCLRSSDASLRYLAADVLYNSCSADNLGSVADQFLAIIRNAPEDSIKATYATKVASLVESYAQPAEYAKTMAEVLVAAGSAAPKALASRIASTLAVCGAPQVQADTAIVFAKLLRGQEALSDAQLLVGLWVVSEYGHRARLSAKEAAGAVLRRASLQRLTLEQETAALTAVFKIVAKAGTQAAGMESVVQPFIKSRQSSRDIMVARLAHFISTALSRPGMLTSVMVAPDEVPFVESESDLRLTALETLVAEQAAQGQPAYVGPDDRYGLFASSAAPVAPTLRTQQYASPTTRSHVTAVMPSPAATATRGGESATPSPPTRAAKPPPRPRAQMGTFSNMMMGRPESPAEPPAAAASASASAGPDAPSRSRPPPVASFSQPADEGDHLADVLFGGGGARRPQQPTVAAGGASVASLPPTQPPPLVDLLGGFVEGPVHDSSGAGALAGGGGRLDDLLGGSSTAQAVAAQPADDLLAGLDGMQLDFPLAAVVGDPFGSMAPAAPAAEATPADLMSGLDMLSKPAPPTRAGVAIGGPGVTQNGNAPLGHALAYGAPHSLPKHDMPQMPVQGGGYDVPRPHASGAPQHMGIHGMQGWAGQGGIPGMMTGIDGVMPPGAPGMPAPSAGAHGMGSGPPGMPPATFATDPAVPVRVSGTLQGKNPDKKGDAFADLLTF